MKITDYSILFMVVVLSFIVIYSLKDNILFRSIVYNEEINRIVDNTTTYALAKGYKGIGDTEEKIDVDMVIESFLKDMCYMLYGADSNKNRGKVSNNIVCFIIVGEDGYYIYEKGKVSEKVKFDEIIHENRVIEIEKIIADKISSYKYKILFPKNSGEKNSQTINPNSLIIIYNTNIKSFMGKEYAECIISGAAIKD